MGLRVIYGSRSDVNARILELAATQPSLLVDCANCADPHALVRYAAPEMLDDILVIEVDVLYKLRDVLLRLSTSSGLAIYITTFDALFHYQDEEENNDVYEQAWLLLRRLSLRCDITVGVRAGSSQEQLARRYGPHSLEPAASA